MQKGFSMSRPKPEIIKTIESHCGITWDVTRSPSHFIITYQGQPCGVRQHLHTLKKHGFKYQKLSYTNLGNARAQVRRLNHKFRCEDFDVMEVC
jgi:hypothetical protein